MIYNNWFFSKLILTLKDDILVLIIISIILHRFCNFVVHTSEKFYFALKRINIYFERWSTQTDCTAGNNNKTRKSSCYIWR